MLHPSSAGALAREHTNDLLRSAERDRMAAELQQEFPLRRRAAASVGHMLMRSGHRLMYYAYANVKAA